MARASAGKRLMAKGLALAACFAFAVLAVGSGMDRRAFMRPMAAARVPGIFANTALLTRGQADLAAGRNADALAKGEAAVRKAPIDPVSPALLAAARLALGDRSGADRAFRIAGQMGWRVPLTQAYWMQQAIALGDWRVAAERFDALLRQQPWLAEDATLLSAMESRPEGRQAIVDRLARASAPWLEAYARGTLGQPVEVIGRRAQVLTAIAKQGGGLGCDAISAPVNGLAEHGRIAEAEALWRLHCQEAGAGLIADPQLAHVRVQSARSHFEWELIGNSDVGIVVVPGGKPGAQAIEMHNSGAAVRVVMRQLVVAPPGTYRLNWQAVTPQGQPSAQLQVSFDCQPGGVVPLVSKALAGSALRQAEARIGAECPARWLVFTLQPGEGDVRLSAVTLEKI